MTGDHIHGAAHIYALANPGLVKATEPAITQIIFETLKITNRAGQRVSVSAASGAVEYVNTEQLWRTGPPPSLPPAEEARKAAETFLRALRTAFSGGGRTPLPERLAGMLLVPPLKPVDIVLVPSRERPVGDHWLYRAQPQLSLLRDERRMADVIGALVEVCIGEGGQVIAFRSQWRPVTAERVYADLAHLPQVDDHSHSAGQRNAPPPDLVYVLDGENLPQFYLSPYYRVIESEHFNMVSASKYSLTVAFSVHETQEGTRITAIPEGGSGQYAYQWAVASIDDPWESQLVELGAGRAVNLRMANGGEIRAGEITVQPGAYLVLVNIKDRDRRTGAFKHHQQYVYSFPQLEEGPREAPLVS
jgi:hypothetical protein